MGITYQLFSRVLLKITKKQQAPKKLKLIIETLLSKPLITG